LPPHGNVTTTGSPNFYRTRCIGQRQVGVVRDDHRLLEVPLEGSEEQQRGPVDVRPLLLRPEDPDCSRPPGVGDARGIVTGKTGK
jgi:hypothetical protein